MLLNRFIADKKTSRLPEASGWLLDSIQASKGRSGNHFRPDGFGDLVNDLIKRIALGTNLGDTHLC